MTDDIKDATVQEDDVSTSFVQNVADKFIDHVNFDNSYTAYRLGKVIIGNAVCYSNGENLTGSNTLFYIDSSIAPSATATNSWCLVQIRQSSGNFDNSYTAYRLGKVIIGNAVCYSNGENLTGSNTLFYIDSSIAPSAIELSI